MSLKVLQRKDAITNLRYMKEGDFNECVICLIMLPTLLRIKVSIITGDTNALQTGTAFRIPVKNYTGLRRPGYMTSKDFKNNPLFSRNEFKPKAALYLDAHFVEMDGDILVVDYIGSKKVVR